MSPEYLALQQAVAGRFSLIRELGRGGMGVVFLARDVALERLVAIKLLPPVLSAVPEARSRFLREARTVAALSHPHIVPIHLVEEHHDLVYFVMGYVEGETLGERVRRAGPLRADEAMRVVQEVAWALAHAHAHDVVHRDVKPDNILLEASTGRALVTDFGIARALEADTPADGVIRGTPQYVSPEVAQGEPGDARSDLYALGVTAWLASTGRLPFEGTSAAAIVLAHVQTAAPSLAAAAPRLPARFALAIDRCLRKPSAERWPSADALAAEIDAARSRVSRVPAPVRAFLREWDSVGSEIATAGTASAVAFTESVAMHVYELTVSGPWSFDASILKWIFAVTAVLTLGMAKARGLQLVSHARAMLREGFGYDRIAAAQSVELAERHDELAAVPLTPAARREAWALLGGIGVGTVAAFALAFSDASGILNVLGSVGAVLLPTLGIRTLWRLGGSDREGLWGRMLRGRVGRWVFRMAGTGLTPPVSASALEGPEPTAIALGQAARELYRGLPAATRASLGELPQLIDALESTAMRLRDSQHDPARAERFVGAVSALETLRLDLLRLRSSALPLPELTAELERVRDFGAAVDRQLAADGDVRQLLKPR